MKTFNINEAASFLCAHKETIRRLAVQGKIPAAKVGRSWLFIEQDLVIYVRSKYAEHVTSQGAISRREKQWRFTEEKIFGGSASRTTAKEYSAALGLPIK